MALWFLMITYSTLVACLNELDTDAQFKNFIDKYNKPYNYGTQEYQKRYAIFKQSLERVEWLNRHRKHEQSALYGITEFSDLTKEEFEQKIVKKVNIFWHDFENEALNHKHRTKRSIDSETDKLLNGLKGLPKKVDWREKGVIGEVYNQGKCGACWAFSTVETIESMAAIKRNETLKDPLSVQQVIDCATEDNHGCDGGDTCAALVWMAENKVKIRKEKEYPLRDDAGLCRIKKTDNSPGIAIRANFTCDNFTHNEPEIVKLLAHHGPLVAAVDATSWQDYLGGVVQYHCENNRNHAVQIVGYDLTADIPYYIVRNSWGPTFGIDGYIHIAIGKNLCGLPEEVSAVDVIL